MRSSGAKFSLRAIRQYRARDIFPFLALRYFLGGEHARSDRFARFTAPQVVRATRQSSYMAVPYFKEFSGSGTLLHREMHMPTAVEALAEAVLIEECSLRAEIPNRAVCFSYWPKQEKDEEGIFEPYMIGLQARQKAVAQAIRNAPDAEVRYLDIKTFYPSIKSEMALRSWGHFTEQIRLPADFEKLGSSLIEKHSKVSNGHILTGPMFSHFIGNIVLRGLDDEIAKSGRRIFRYVDDFIVVGGKSLQADVDWLRSKIEEVGLDAHEPDSAKSLSVSGAEWLRSASDFESGDIAKAWMTLVGDIKKVLLIEPDIGERLVDRLREDGFRLPIRAYQTAVKDAGTFSRVRELRLWGWIKAKARGVSIETILRDAISLRDTLETQLLDLFELGEPDSEFQRKRRITKLRYRMGRSLYLSEKGFFERVVNHRSEWPELEVHFALMDALITGRGDQVVRMGGNVAQAAAQLFSAAGENVEFLDEVKESTERIGLAIFAANGVKSRTRANVLDGPILQYATGPISRQMFSTFTGFLRDAACLHGIGEARHGEIMKRAYDVAEEVHFDAISLDYGYSF